MSAGPSVKPISTGEAAQELWEGTEVVVIVDAVRCTPAAPGRWHRTTLPHTLPAASTHGFGVPEAVEPADALDRRPAHLVVYAVEITDTGLSPAVAAAVAPLTAAIRAELSLPLPL